MPILNYTTTVDAEKTIAQVHRLLVAAGARSILTNYESGHPSAVSFAIETSVGIRQFTLPVHPDRVRAVLQRDGNVAPRFCTPEHADRVAWRIIKDWLEAQLAIIKTEMVTFDEVMLPYMRSDSGSTFYELYSKHELEQQLALTAGET